MRLYLYSAIGAVVALCLTAYSFILIDYGSARIQAKWDRAVAYEQREQIAKAKDADLSYQSTYLDRAALDAKLKALAEEYNEKFVPSGSASDGIDSAADVERLSKQWK